jgi:hypothetical protein
MLPATHAADFGRLIYGNCFKNGSTITSGPWEHEFTFPNGKTKMISLSSTDDAYTRHLYDLGRLASCERDVACYSNQPEVACYAICQNETQFGPSGCGTFTYDGLNNDTCGHIFRSCSLRPMSDIYECL